jgi:hypothetical protein
MSVPPPVGYVTVSSSDPPIDVTALLADERPDVTSGFGGWDAVERPRRPPLTTWKAPPGLRMTLPLMLDEWVDELSIEWQVEQLEALGQPTGSDGEPPQVTVTATGGAVPYQDRTWVVDNITFGDALMNDDGDRVRQQVTLELLEYVEDVYLTEVSAANRRRAQAAKTKGKPGATHKRVTAKRTTKAVKTVTRSVSATAAGEFGLGESLVSIAARELGDATRWTEIAALNGMRDPRAVTPGQVLRMP